MVHASLKKVASTSFHVEWALKWADACVGSVLGKPPIWKSRDISTSGILKRLIRHDMSLPLHELHAFVQIIGKVERLRLKITITFNGDEESVETLADDKPRAVSHFHLRVISIEVQAETGESAQYSFSENQIPGYVPSELFAA